MTVPRRIFYCNSSLFDEMGKFGIIACVNPLLLSARGIHTAELHRSNRLGTIKTGSSQRWFKPARVSFYIYKLNSRDSCPIYGVSAVILSSCYFHFLFLVTLKEDDENNCMKT